MISNRTLFPLAAAAAAAAAVAAAAAARGASTEYGVLFVTMLLLLLLLLLLQLPAWPSLRHYLLPNTAKQSCIYHSTEPIEAAVTEALTHSPTCDY